MTESAIDDSTVEHLTHLAHYWVTIGRALPYEVYRG